jgi:hypothetical protein
MSIRSILCGVAIAGAVGGPLLAQASKEAENGRVTLVGCIEMEKDYRARLHASRGGVLNTGLGEGKDFVLSNSTPAPGAKGGKAVAGDYSLSGKLEPELVRQIGKQVEIVGTVKPFSAPRSAEADRDQLPKLVVELWHPFSDFCPQPKTQQ